MNSQFKMACPKCSQPIECPMEYFDQLITCPSCQEQILARPLATVAPATADFVSAGPLSDHVSPQDAILYRALPSSAPLYLSLVIIAVFFVCLGKAAVSSTDQETRTGFLAAAGVALALLLGATIVGKMSLKSTEVVLTDNRVILSWGVINKRTVETFLDKVEGIDVQQSIVGRLFRFGSVAVRGTGGGGTPCPGIQNPHEFRRAVIEQIKSKRLAACRT